jgi:hypothetical protein
MTNSFVAEAHVPHSEDAWVTPVVQAAGNKSASINAIAEALSKAQEELESAKKDNAGYGYNYSDLATVIATAKPILAKHGLAVTQLIGATTNNFVTVTTILTHSSGQFFETTGTLPLIDMKGCNTAQCAGASLSYLRRYAYQAILGMASEDSDASSEGFKTTTTKKVTNDAKTKSKFKRRGTTTTESTVKSDDDF